MFRVAYGRLLLAVNMQQEISTTAQRVVDSLPAVLLLLPSNAATLVVSPLFLQRRVVVEDFRSNNDTSNWKFRAGSLLEVPKVDKFAFSM